MRPIRSTVNAANPNGPWVELDYLSTAFGVGIAVLFSESSNLTCTVQYTLDDNSEDSAHYVSVSRAGTVATVTDPTGPSPNNLLPGHGLLAGDSVYIEGTGTTNLDGWQTVVTTPTETTYTYTVANSGPTADTGTTKAKNFRVFPHAVLAAITARNASNFIVPVKMCRLLATAGATGFATMVLLQQSGR